MSPEKETFHVVIRIPTKRPQGFVEPPSIVWTDEMEHKLWQYMSQKNTDWNVIAEQLGVPTSYIVRHAAFIYETQLRGIHQQLRLNVNNSSMTKASMKSPTPSLKKPASSRYSNTLQQQQQQQQQQYIHDMGSQKQVEIRNNNGSSSNLNNADMAPQSPIDKSDSSVKTTRSPSHSLYKSSMLQTENTSYKNESSDDDNNNNDRSMDSNDSEEDDNDDDDEEDDDNDTKEDDEEDEEERFSSHFERIKLQVEEPAFLARRLESSTGSLSASRNQLSLSIQNLRKPSNAFSAEGSIASPKKILSPQTRSPATRPGSNNESAINSSTSSFSDISETSVTQSAMEDAFLSNFDHAGGSKISSFMSFTRK